MGHVGKKKYFWTTVQIVEMESEDGAARAVQGSLPVHVDDIKMRFTVIFDEAEEMSASHPLRHIN